MSRHISKKYYENRDPITKQIVHNNFYLSKQVKNSNCFYFHQTDISSAIQSMYSSSLTIDSQTYSSTDCDPKNYYYEAIQVTVTKTGYYGFDRNSSIDTYGFIYKNSFNPFNLYENIFSLDDNNCSHHQFKAVVQLQTNTTYIWVVTTRSPDVTGAFSIFVFGSNKVSLNRVGKYMC